MNSQTNIKEGYVSVTGGRVWYQMVGTERKEIPLLVIHGGPGAPHDYLEPLKGLADKRPVIFYDQLGCGNSDKPGDKSLWKIEKFVEEIQLIHDSLNLNKVHLLGQSWGTALAVEYMLTRKPEGVISLVLSGPLLSTSRWVQDQKAYLSELPEDIQMIIQKAEKTGDFSSSQYQEAMMAYYKLHVCRLETWPDCLNRAFNRMNLPLYEYMWGPSEFSVTGTLKNYDRVNRLNEIKVPVLFTCGRYDEAAPATTKYYQNNLPGSRVHIFEDASHEHHLEKPAEYLRIISEFLRSAEKDLQ